MQTTLKQRRIVDKILTKVVMGYDLDQEFSGHHLFPDVDVPKLGGTIIKWGKDAFIIINTKRAPGETVRGISVSYSSDSYVLEERLLEAQSPIEELEESETTPGIKLKTRSVNTVFRKMRLEGEYDKAQLATTAANYATNHTAALSGSSIWSDPTADVLTQVDDAKSTIRSKTGREPNTFLLSYKSYKALKKNAAIKEQFKYSGKDSITLAMLANYFDVEKVVIGKSVGSVDESSDFFDLWGKNSILAYVPPKNLQAKEYPSYGYNYVHRGFPVVEKEYYWQADRSWHNPVEFRDKAIMTDNTAGFLFSNTVA